MILALRRLCQPALIATAVVLVCANSAWRTYHNALAWPQTRDGQCGAIAVGDGVVTSSHFTNARPLYDALRATNINAIYAEPLLGWCLSAFDIGAGRLSVTTTKQEGFDALASLPPYVAEYRRGPYELTVANSPHYRRVFDVGNFLVYQRSVDKTIACD